MNPSRHWSSSPPQLRNKPAATVCAATQTIHFSTAPGSIQRYGENTSVELAAPPNLHGTVSTLAVHYPS